MWSPPPVKRAWTRPEQRWPLGSRTKRVPPPLPLKQYSPTMGTPWLLWRPVSETQQPLRKERSLRLAASAGISRRLDCRLGLASATGLRSGFGFSATGLRSDFGLGSGFSSSTITWSPKKGTSGSVSGFGGSEMMASNSSARTGPAGAASRMQKKSDAVRFSIGKPSLMRGMMRGLRRDADAFPVARRRGSRQTPRPWHRPCKRRAEGGQAYSHGPACPAFPALPALRFLPAARIFRSGAIFTRRGSKRARMSTSLAWPAMTPAMSL